MANLVLISRQKPLARKDLLVCLDILLFYFPLNLILNDVVKVWFCCCCCCCFLCSLGSECSWYSVIYLRVTETLYMFSSKNYRDAVLVYRTVIHSDFCGGLSCFLFSIYVCLFFVFVYMIWGEDLTLFICIYSVSPAPFLEMTIFHQSVFLAPFSKINWPYVCNYASTALSWLP